MTRAQQLIQTINGLLAPGSGITAQIHQTVEASIVNFAANQWVTGDLKMIDCTNEYINQNFDSTGKGIPGTLREGWAICNGNNNTMNRTGRVPVGWGGVTTLDSNGTSIQQPNMKTLGGSPIIFGNNNEALSVAQMPTHSHDFMIRQDSSGVSGNFQTLANTSNSDEGGFSTYAGGDTTTSDLTIKNKGGGAVHNNVQPSMVTLFIQKIDEV